MEILNYSPKIKSENINNPNFISFKNQLTLLHHGKGKSNKQ